MQRLCAADRVIEGLPVKVSLPGRAPLAVFRHADRILVVDANCTHGQALLTEGHQSGWQVQCPLHGGAFDLRDGRAIAAPCRTPLRTYCARVIDGNVVLVEGSSGAALDGPAPRRPPG